MYMNIHKTGFSAVFHISVMIFKLTHLIHLDLDHQNVFRQFHILFNQNQINSSIRLSGIRLSGIRLSGIRLSGIRLSGIRLSGIRLSGIRLSGIRLSGIRLSGIRLPGIRLSGIRLSGIRLSGIRLSGIVYPVSVYPVSVYPVSGTRLFYHAAQIGFMHLPNLHTTPKRHLIKIKTFLKKNNSYLEKYKFLWRFEKLSLLFEVCSISKF